MEVKNTQRSIPVFEIPINDYEIDMENETSKENKNEILNLFKNQNQLNSEQEFQEIKDKLHYACEKGDLDLIKILLSETIQDATNDLTFKIDKTKQTASLFKANQNLGDAIIPRIVKHEMKDYLVTSITSIGSSYRTESKIKSVKFEEDSSVSTIYGRAFSESTINEIYFPKNLIELKEGWCNDTRNLTKIIVSPSNKQFIFKDDKYLLGKSDQKNDEFDILLFVRRDIDEISIPSNIKIIGSCSFSDSTIEEVFIPANVTKICENAFSNCSYLRKVEIPTNSNLQTIERNAFFYSVMDKIYFPKSLINLKEGWCYKTIKLAKIIISPYNEQFIFKDDKYLLCKSDQKNKEFDILLFVRRDIDEISIPSNIKIIGSCSFQYSAIKEISIPSNVTKICENAFSNCSNLRKIEIPTNSNLQTIEKNAFSSSKIEEISVPSNLTKICERAFSSCYNLRKVEIPTNSNLQTIERYAFSYSTIEEISIPSNVTKISEYLFCNCPNLTKVEIPTNSNLQIIERNAFAESKIEEIYFPKSLIELKEGWCYKTTKLTKINISPSNDQFMFKDDKYLLGKSDQNKNEFDLFLFVKRDIDEISIPSNVTRVRENAFSNCSNLKKVEIPTNSTLQTIERNAFTESTIEEISIPSSVTKICKNAFSYCSNLRKVEIPTNSNLQTIERNAFTESKIEEISIPSNITKICENVFSNCFNLRKVEIPANSNLQTIGKNAFTYSIIKEIFIPSSVTKICEKAFYGCSYLNKVEIPKYSNLQTIEKSAFSCSKIEGIFIPSSVTKICEKAFIFCKNLLVVEISEESKLHSIPKSAFEYCPKLIILIPLELEKMIQTINST